MGGERGGDHRDGAGEIVEKERKGGVCGCGMSVPLAANTALVAQQLWGDRSRLQSVNEDTAAVGGLAHKCWLGCAGRALATPSLRHLPRCAASPGLSAHPSTGGASPFLGSSCPHRPHPPTHPSAPHRPHPPTHRPSAPHRHLHAPTCIPTPPHLCSLAGWCGSSGTHQTSRSAWGST